jgi:hypothetical protein
MNQHGLNRALQWPHGLGVQFFAAGLLVKHALRQL